MSQFDQRILNYCRFLGVMRLEKCNCSIIISYDARTGVFSCKHLKFWGSGRSRQTNSIGDTIEDWWMKNRLTPTRRDYLERLKEEVVSPCSI